MLNENKNIKIQDNAEGKMSQPSNSEIQKSVPDWVSEVMNDFGYMDVGFPWADAMFVDEWTIECIVVSSGEDKIIRLFATNSKFEADCLVYHSRIVKSSKQVELFIRDIEAHFAV